jgi:hypothetical protein
VLELLQVMVFVILFPGQVIAISLILLLTDPMIINNRICVIEYESYYFKRGKVKKKMSAPIIARSKIVYK